VLGQGCALLNPVERMQRDRVIEGLHESSDAVLARLSGPLADHIAPETHVAVIELATGIHADVTGLLRSLRLSARSWLARWLA
jgi:hypothetical protein